MTRADNINHNIKFVVVEKLKINRDPYLGPIHPLRAKNRPFKRSCDSPFRETQMELHQPLPTPPPQTLAGLLL
jgi:hypothetical protein